MSWEHGGESGRPCCCGKQQQEEHAHGKLLKLNPLQQHTMSWDNARRHARALETAVDAKLASYSKLASVITRGETTVDDDEDGAGGYKLIEEQIDELLVKVGQLVVTADAARTSHRRTHGVDQLSITASLGIHAACGTAPS